MKKLILLIAITVLGYGCHDPKKANNENFKAAIEPYLKSKFPSCFYTGQFPVEIKGFSLSVSNNHKKMDALTDVGFLEFKKTGEQKLQLISGEKRTIEIGSYHLSDKGKAAYTENAVETLGGNNIGGFCLGEPVITEITNFTEPSVFLGQKISNVKFQYKVKNLPDWAKSEKLNGYFPIVNRYLNSEKESIHDSAVLIFTEKGWIHEKFFNK